MKKLKLLLLFLLPLTAFGQQIYNLPFDTVNIKKNLKLPNYGAGLVQLDATGHVSTISISSLPIPSGVVPTTLTSNTNVSVGTNTLTLKASGTGSDVGEAQVSIARSSLFMGMHSTTGPSDVANISINGTTALTLTIGGIFSSTHYNTLTYSNNGIIVDTWDKKGIQTDGDYSPFFVGNSYITKTFGDTHYAPISGGAYAPVFSGTTGQYVTAAGTYVTFPTNLSAFTNDGVFMPTTFDGSKYQNIQNINDHAAIIVQNNSSGNNANASLRAKNDAGNFVQLGINGSGFASAGNIQSQPSAAILMTTAQKLYIGSKDSTQKGEVDIWGGLQVPANVTIRVDSMQQVWLHHTVSGTAGTDSLLSIAGGKIKRISGGYYAPTASPVFSGTVSIPGPFLLNGTTVNSTATELDYLNHSTGTTGDVFSNVVFSGAPTLKGLLLTGLSSGATGTDSLLVHNSVNSTVKLIAANYYATASSVATNTSNIASNYTAIGLKQPRIILGDPGASSATIASGDTVNMALWKLQKQINTNTTGIASFTPSTTNTITNKDLTSGTNIFPTFNQNTTGSAAKWTTARTLGGNSVDGSANVAFANKFIVQGTTDAGLSAAQFMGALGTGIIKNTTTTGVFSIAVAADFPTLNQSTTGNAATATALQTIRTINGVNFDGTANITVTANTPNNLTPGYALLGTAFNGGTAYTWNVDTSKVSTILGLKDTISAHAATPGYAINVASNVFSVDSTLVGSKSWAFAAFYTKNQILASSHAYTASSSISINNAAATTSVGFELLNNNAATLNNQMYTPYLHFSSNGWGTTSGASEDAQWRIYSAPAQGATPNPILNFDTQVNGGGWTNRLTLSGGTITGQAFLGNFGNITTGNTSDAYYANNSTAATSGVPNQYSPNIHMRAEVWNTTSVAANNWVDFKTQVLTTSGTTPLGKWTLSGSLTTTSTASYTDLLTVDNSGNMTLLTGLFFPKVYTVSGLPSASANTGAVAEVSDASSPTYGATVTGGSSTKTLVMSNGTNWIAH